MTSLIARARIPGLSLNLLDVAIQPLIARSPTRRCTASTFSTPSPRASAQTPASPLTSVPTTPDSILFLPSPPPSPAPWRWQCHHCHTSYDLAITHRCLNDGHRFCSGQQHSAPNHCMTSNPPQRSRHRSRKHKGTCTSTFDFPRWRARNAWRREVAQLRVAHAERGRAVPPEQHGDRQLILSQLDVLDDTDGISSMKTAMDAARSSKGNCSLDCDSPSECLHVHIEREKMLGAQAKIHAQAQTEERARVRESKDRMNSKCVERAMDRKSTRHKAEAQLDWGSDEPQIWQVEGVCDEVARGQSQHAEGVMSCAGVSGSICGYGWSLRGDGWRYEREDGGVDWEDAGIAA